MLQERLLERINRLEEEQGEQVNTQGLNRNMDSIILHLQRLLNTRQGSVPIADDYGVPDITNVPGDNIAEARDNVERMIQEVVRKYEPRLEGITMTMQQDKNDPFSLKFRLEAHLAKDNKVPVIFETVVSTDGKINVS